MSDIDLLEEAIIHGPNFYLDELHQSGNLDRNNLQLSADKFYTIALLNSKQLFINFQNILHRLDTSLSIRSDLKTGTISIGKLGNQNGPEWKAKILRKLCSFFTNQAGYYRLKLSARVTNNRKCLELLQNYIMTLNKRFSALFFHINYSAGVIDCYGTKLLLREEIDSMKDMMRVELFNIFNKSTSKPAFKPIEVVSIAIKPLGFFATTLLECKKIFSDFQQDLNRINADLMQTQESNLVIKSVCKKPFDKDEWKSRVDSLMNEYEHRIEEQIILIPTELNLIGQAELFRDLNVNMQALAYKAELDFINVFGYAEVVNEFVGQVKSKFESLLNDIKVKQLLEIKIALNTNDYKVFKSFNQIHLQEFELVLKQCDAIIIKSPHEFIIKYETTDEISSVEMAIDWKKRVNQRIKTYLAKFKRQSFELKQQTAEVNKLLIGNPKISYNWVDKRTIELFGFVNEVNKAIGALNCLNKKQTNTNSAQTSKFQTLNDESDFKSSLDDSGDRHEPAEDMKIPNSKPANKKKQRPKKTRHDESKVPKCVEKVYKNFLKNFAKLMTLIAVLVLKIHEIASTAEEKVENEVPLIDSNNNESASPNLNKPEQHNAPAGSKPHMSKNQQAKELNRQKMQQKKEAQELKRKEIEAKQEERKARREQLLKEQLRAEQERIKREQERARKNRSYQQSFFSGYQQDYKKDYTSTHGGSYYYQNSYNYYQDDEDDEGDQYFFFGSSFSKLFFGNSKNLLNWSNFFK